MRNINLIIKYLVSLGFQVESCRIPLNRWETLKRDYLYNAFPSFGPLCEIKGFLLKRFPIKYKSERPEKSIWLSLKQNNHTVIELELKPKSKAQSIDFMTFEYSNFDFNTWRIRTLIDPGVLKDLKSVEEFYLYFNNHTWEEAIEEIEYHFVNNSFLKERIRDRKLTELLDGK